MVGDGIGADPVDGVAPSEPVVREVAKSLLDLFFGIHDEGAAEDDGSRSGGPLNNSNLQGVSPDPPCGIQSSAIIRTGP